jgi:hypothetical protein
MARGMESHGQNWAALEWIRRTSQAPLLQVRRHGLVMPMSILMGMSLESALAGSRWYRCYPHAWINCGNKSQDSQECTHHGYTEMRINFHGLTKRTGHQIHRKAVDHPCAGAPWNRKLTGSRLVPRQRTLKPLLAPDLGCTRAVDRPAPSRRRQRAAMQGAGLASHPTGAKVENQDHFCGDTSVLQRHFELRRGPGSLGKLPTA